MKPILGIDIETYSPVSLPKAGVYRYVDADEFEILLFSYAYDDGPVQTVDLACGEKLPDNILSDLENPAIIKAAYNAQFERVCLSKYLGHWLDPHQWRCTAVMAAYLTMPARLADAAVALAVTEQKMEEGKELIRFFSTPCKPTKANGERTRNLPHHAPDKWAVYKQYNAQDVETERAVRKACEVHPMPESEWALYALDQIINDRGVRVDKLLVEQAMAVDSEFTEAAYQRAKEITGLENPGSVAQLKAWLADQDVPMESLAKKLVQERATNTEGLVSELLSLRLELSKTSIKKYEAIARCVCRDGRVHGMLQFYGANRTGRWSGRLCQVQNLPQNHLEDLDLARAIVKTGDTELVEMLYGSVPNTLSELIRTALIPKEGCRFIVADFSAIEARVLAWLAGEDWVLDEFRGAGKIYEATASRMFHVPKESIVKGNPNYEYRQKGKQATLSCIAEGELVLTDHGLIPIEQVTLNERLWDGEQWVHHDGVVFRGVKRVITYSGLTATPDHRVWVSDRAVAVTLGFAAMNGLKLVCSEPDNPDNLGSDNSPDSPCSPDNLCSPTEDSQGFRRAKTYDIVNAGPYHRFTVSGHLVHNCGYGGGVGALKNMGAKMPEEEMQPLVDAWRAANPHIVAFWSAMDRAMRKVIKEHGSVRVGKVRLYWKDDKALMRLPSGRDLCYLAPHTVKNRFGHDGIGYLAPSGNGKLIEQETFGGKLVENCLARGTLVLTDKGLVPIEDIKASHLLWDGEAFVYHDGLIDKGIQEVVCVDGLLMTENHKILSDRGWISCGQSDGLNWAKVSLPDYFASGRKQQAWKTAMVMSMHMRERGQNSGIGFAEESTSCHVMRLHEDATDSGKTHHARHVTPSCICSMAFHETALLESESQGVPQLWWPGNNGVLGVAKQLCPILERYGAELLPWLGIRSNRQQRWIYTAELSMGLADDKSEEQEKVQDCRYAVRKNDCCGVERTNRNRRNDALVQAGSQLADAIVVHRAGFQAQVYDIRNCGPRHRFTVYDPVTGQFRIVSNCTQSVARDILAHAMLNLEAHGYRIVFHVHDECVMEMPVGIGSIEEACAIMSQTPDWCSDLPLRADGYECASYRKS